VGKKRRSAKQKAATRKLVALNKRRGAPKRRKSSKPRKTNKRKSRSKSVAKRRSSSRARGITSKIPLINNPTFKKAATGIGIATLGVAVLSLVLPQVANQPLVKPVLALLGGGVPGVVAQFLVQGSGGLTNIFGGGGNGAGAGAAGNTGFA